MKGLSVMFLVSVLFLSISADTNGTYINVNPDPNGDPWIIGGYVSPTFDDSITEDEKKAILEEQRRNPLPDKVNNCFTKYSPSVFSQVGGSCGSASRINYMFAFEINNYYRRDASLPENIYPSHFTWMLTSQGSSKEDMARDNGVPNSIVYGGTTYSKIYGTKNQDGFSSTDYGWMAGYDKWYSAMPNRIVKITRIDMETAQDIEVLKGWLYNHNGDTTFAFGGYAGLGIASSGMKLQTIPEGMPEAGKKIVISFGSSIDHATTAVGYDVNVAWDYNNDGQISNDIDMNGDGKVTPLDWEKGAVIMLNSWGSGWGDGGVAYVPYRLLKNMHFGSAQLFWARKDYKPQRVMKITMSYSERCNIQLKVGIHDDVNAQKPQKELVCHHFNYGGRGKVPMLGKWADGVMHDEPMEFGYDVTDLTKEYDTEKPLKYFLIINSKSAASGTGSVVSMSIMNYKIDENGDETVSPETNISIKGGGDQTLVSVEVPGDATPIQSHDVNRIAGLNGGIRMNRTNKVLRYSYLVSQNGSTPVTLFLIDPRGKMIREVKTVALKGKNNISIDISGVAKGIYFLRISGRHGNIGGRVVIY